MPKTWGGRSRFEYSGSVATGTEIVFGRGWKTKVSAEDYRALRQHFKGRIVPLGSSRTVPPPDSMGAWLQTHVTRLALVVYIGQILVLEGYAERVGKHDICIIK